MKKLFNSLMSLDSNSAIGNDYGMIIFLLFLEEKDCLSQNKIDINELTKYIYRFYLDNPLLKSHKSNKTIVNLELFSITILDSYIKSLLDNLKIRIECLRYNEQIIWFDYNLESYDAVQKKLLHNIINMMVKKYINIPKFSYNSELNDADFNNYKHQKIGNKLFNRVIENINYCFICEETNVQKLRLIRLNENTNHYDISNYLLVCSKHATDFDNHLFYIDYNGYVYSNKIKTPYHLEISCLKIIRNNLKQI